MATALDYLSDLIQLIHLQRYIPTFRAIISDPVRFFSEYKITLEEKQDIKLFRFNFEHYNDDYMGPVNFALVTLAFSNLLFPIILEFGVLVGAVSIEYYNFIYWTRATGFTGLPQFTRVAFIDGFIAKMLGILLLYSIGVFVSLSSKYEIPYKFAAGHFFYIGAWNLMESLATIVFIFISIVMPIYYSGIPQFVNGVILLGFYFMCFGFPLVYWPKILGIPRRTIAISLGLGLVMWFVFVIFFALALMPFVEMPQF